MLNALKGKKATLKLNILKIKYFKRIKYINSKTYMFKIKKSKSYKIILIY